MNSILHLSPLSAVGGCEINCLRLIESLPEFKHYVLVFGAPGPMDERWSRAGAHVEHLSAWKLGTWAFTTRLRQWAKTQPIPIGIYYWSSSRLPFVLSAFKRWDVPWGVYLGNPLMASLTTGVRLSVWRLFTIKTGNVTLVACSRYVEKSHTNAAFFRCFRSITIYNAVGFAFDTLREHRLLMPRDCIRVGMVARLDSIKDHATLIYALPGILKDWPKLRLEFAGTGDLRESLLSLAKKLNVAENVVFLGSVSGVPELLRYWDVYLHSTTPNEGMGTAVAEAMMAGLPCVLSDIEVMREVGGADEVLYVDPDEPGIWAETICMLLNDQPRRAALGQSAQIRARNLFSSDAVAKAYLNILIQHD